MTEYEAYDLAVQLLGFVHELGEAIQSRIEFWSGVSYGLIALAYIAPNKLTFGVTSFLLALYTAFTISTVQNVGFDMDTAAAGRRDAMQLVENHDLIIEAVTEKARPDRDWGFAVLRYASSLYVPGLFFGAIGYIGITCFRQRKLTNGSANST